MYLNIVSKYFISIVSIFLCLNSSLNSHYIMINTKIFDQKQHFKQHSKITVLQKFDIQKNYDNYNIIITTHKIWKFHPCQSVELFSIGMFKIENSQNL